MDNGEAKRLLDAQRSQLQQLLSNTESAGREDREAEAEVGDEVDPAQALTAEGVDNAIATGLTERLAAVDRAEERLNAGTFGRSIRSGQSIPDERLRADPAAELTVQEAAERA